MVVNFEYDKDFFKVNPQFKLIDGFKGVFALEGVSNKDKSKIAWFVAFYSDSDSVYKNYPREDRITIICADVIGDDDFYVNNKHYIDDCIRAYRSISETPARRQLRIWNMKMDEKSKFLESLKYDMDTWEAIDKMLNSNKAAYDLYKKIMKDMSEESDIRIKGNTELSFMEKENE